MAFDNDQIKFALIYQCLEEVDQELAQKFKKNHKPASLDKFSTLFNDMILYFVNTNENGQKVVKAVTKMEKSSKKKIPAKVLSKKGNGFSKKRDTDNVAQVQTQVMPTKKSKITKASVKKVKTNLKESSFELPAKKSRPKEKDETSTEDDAQLELPIIKSDLTKTASAESSLNKSSSGEKQPKNKTIPIKSKSVKFVEMKAAKNSEKSDNEFKTPEEKSKPAAGEALSTKSILKKAKSWDESSFTDKNLVKKSLRKKAKQSDCKDTLRAKKIKAPAQPIVKSSRLNDGSEKKSAATKKPNKTKRNFKDATEDEPSPPEINTAPAKKESSVKESNEDEKPSKGLKRKTEDAAGGPVEKKNKLINYLQNYEDKGEKSQGKNKFGGHGGRRRDGFRGKRNSFNHGANENRDGD